MSTKEKAAPRQGRGPDCTAASRSAALDPTPARRIVIAVEPFDDAALDVMLEPQPAAGPIAREFRSLRRARGFADGLALAFGLPIVDRSGRTE